jgi:hypothetical protein
VAEAYKVQLLDWEHFTATIALGFAAIAVNFAVNVGVSASWG